MKNAAMTPQTLSINLPATGDWATPLTFLAERCVEEVEEPGPPYRRSAQTGAGETGWVHLSVDSAVPLARIRFSGLPLEFVAARSRRLLGLFEQPREALDHLKRDPLLSPALTAGLPRLPGAWDGFEMACRAVLGQQVTVKAARTLARRLCARLGTELPEERRVGTLRRCFPTPKQIAGGDMDGLGITARRVETLRRLGEQTVSGASALGADPGLGAASLEAFVERMIALPGIGSWTAHYIALRAFAAENAFPPGDVGLLRAYRRLGGDGGARALDQHAVRWAPYRGYAALALWQYDAARGGSRPASPPSSPPVPSAP